MALSGSGWFDAALDDIVNQNIDIVGGTIKAVGINATGEGALSEDDADPNYDDISGNSYNTHGPMTVSVTYSGGKWDMTDLSGTFTDPANGNGDTSCIIWYLDTGTPSTSRLIAYAVLSSAVAQDGTDDDLTANASGIATLYT